MHCEQDINMEDPSTQESFQLFDATLLNHGLSGVVPPPPPGCIQYCGFYNQRNNTASSSTRSSGSLTGLCAWRALFAGKHNIARLTWDCSNPQCLKRNHQGHAFFVEHVGAFPLTPDDSLRCTTFVFEQLFLRWRRHQFHGRAPALKRFLRQVQDEGVLVGNTVRVLIETRACSFVRWQEAISTQGAVPDCIH